VEVQIWHAEGRGEEAQAEASSSDGKVSGGKAEHKRVKRVIPRRFQRETKDEGKAACSAECAQWTGWLGVSPVWGHFSLAFALRRWHRARIQPRPGFRCAGTSHRWC
jgi:hypothetical protein